MDRNRRSIARSMTVLGIAAFLVMAGIGVGCSSDDDHHVTQTNFYGVYSDPGASGTISLFALSAATTGVALGGETPLTLAGEITINGTVTDLVGLWYVGSGVIHFETDDGAYVFDGVVSGATVNGTATGPNGDGAFVLWVGGTSSNVATYCATAVCTTLLCNETAFFNFANAGSTSLLVIDYGGDIFVAAGSASSSTVDFHIVESGVDFTIEGDISGSSISGVWSDAINNVGGTFSGSTAACSTTKRR